MLRSAQHDCEDAGTARTRRASGTLELAAGLDDALRDADVAVLATAWPEFQALQADDLLRRMRHPRLVDEAGFLPHLADDPRLTYVRVGRPILRR
jgi:hypothetical protein